MESCCYTQTSPPLINSHHLISSTDDAAAAADDDDSTTPMNMIDFKSLTRLIILIDSDLSQFLINTYAKQPPPIQLSPTHYSYSLVLSSLSSGIETIQEALTLIDQSDDDDDDDDKERRTSSCLLKAEELLQNPALLDVHAKTGDVENHIIVSSAYFYLSLVWKLRGDAWQMASHFLQALLLSTPHLRRHFAPLVSQHMLFSSCQGHDETCNNSDTDDTHYSKKNTMPTNGFCAHVVIDDVVDDDVVDEVIREETRRYKKWLMYHQVVLYGERIPLKRFHSFDQKFNSRCCSAAIGAESLDSFTEADAGNHRKEVKIHKANRSTDTHAKIGSLGYLKDVDQSINMSTSPKWKLFACDFRKLEEECPFGSDRCLKQTDYVDEMSKSLSISMRSYGLWSHEEFSGPRTCCGEDCLCCMKDYFSGILQERGNVFLDQTDDKIDLFVKKINPKHLEGEQWLPLKFIHSRREGTLSLDNDNNNNNNNNWDHNKICMETGENFRTALSVLFSSNQQGDQNEHSIVEVSLLWEKLESKITDQCIFLKEVIFCQLIHLLLSSEVEEVTKACISILCALIQKDRSTIVYVKRTHLNIQFLVHALKRKIYEAVILIYLLNTAPDEIKSLEILPALVEVVCTVENHYKKAVTSPALTPTDAALRMINRLVTAYDSVTNTVHVKTMLSLRILPGLVNLVDFLNHEEVVYLANILVKCMRSDGNCRVFLSQAIPLKPFICLLQDEQQHARCAALEFFYEILRMPRMSSLRLIRKMQHEHYADMMATLLTCIHEVKNEYQLFASGLMIELDTMGDLAGNNTFRTEAMNVLLRSVSFGNGSTQKLAASMLANIGGNYTITGEPATSAWLIKKTGLRPSVYRSMLRNSIPDKSSQDAESEIWSRSVSKAFMLSGIAVFEALAKGLQSNTHGVHGNCLIAAARFGYELSSMGVGSLQDAACDSLLSKIIPFLHPGSEFEERLLACLFVFNYASCHGMQTLVSMSKELQQPLRRLSNVTWVAEELVRVIDYSNPPKPSNQQISWSHIQILEFCDKSSGVIHALTYYRGHLCTGHSDGSIKVWNINGGKHKLLVTAKEHKKAVTCFALHEPGESLLSSSRDKTIRIWQMSNNNLECMAMIEFREAVLRIDAHDSLIFAVTRSRGLKVCDASKVIKVVAKHKYLRSICVEHGKIYIGCKDSSIQEVDMTTDETREVERPAKRWWRQSKPTTSLVVYRDLLYSSGAAVKGSNVKARRKQNGTVVMSATSGKGSRVQAMSVVEDFLYLVCKSSPCVLEVWLRAKQQKVMNIFVGSRITCLYVANDVVFCGTKSGSVKAWIPR